MTVMLAVAATACGGNEQEAKAVETPTTLDGLVEAAQEEGSLVWYSSMDESVTKDVSEAFQEQYGIDVEYVRLVTSDLLQRYGAEAQAGTVNGDVVVASHGTWGSDFASDGFLIDVRDAEIPDLEDFPSELYGESLAQVGSEVHGIAINTDLVSADEAPTDWSDLADPKWKDQILLIDPASSAGYPSTWVLIADKYGDDVLKGIAANARLVSPGMIPMFEQLAAGEGAIGVPGLTSVANGLAADGAPIDSIQFDYSPMFFHSLGISADAPHPNAARLFAHWMMVGEGQSISNDPDKYGRCSPVTLEGCPSNAVPQQLEHLEQADRIVELLSVSD